MPDVLLPEPLPHQIPILVDPSRFKVVACGRRWGKTLSGLIAAIDGHGPNHSLRGALDQARVWWLAPTFGIASDAWRDLKVALRDAWSDKNEVERRITLINGGIVEVRSADDPDRLRGAALDGVIFDEAAHTRQLEHLWKAVVRPMLADRQGWAMFISTPSGLNFFEQLWREAATEKDWARFQHPTSDNPRIAASEIEVARRQLGPLMFSQEFLAQFVTAGAGFFKREWFRYYDAAPHTFWRFATVDLAASLKTSADYTVIASGGVAEGGRLILLDVERSRMEGPDIVPAIRRAVQRWNLATVGIERVGFQLALVQEARRAGLPVRELLPDRDKVARSLPLQAALEGGRVLFPRSAPWLADLEQELLAFPAGAHDDLADVAAYAVAMLASWAPALPGPPVEEARRASPLDSLQLGRRPW